MRFDLNALSFYLSTTQSLENIALMEVIPEHIDPEFVSVSDTNIYTRETFRNYTMIPSIHSILIYSPKLMECCLVMNFSGIMICMEGIY